MEHFVQGFEAAKTTSMDLLGSFVKLAPGYKPPTATNARGMPGIHFAQGWIPADTPRLSQILAVEKGDAKTLCK